MKDWIVIYKVSDLVDATIMKGMLEENEIPVQLLNKKDSSYLTFGYIELYVPVTFKELAEGLVKKSLLN